MRSTGSGEHHRGTDQATRSEGEGQGGAGLPALATDWATGQLTSMQEKFPVQERTKRIQQEGTGY